MRQLIDAYVDIETTGLSAIFHYITVIGIYRCEGLSGEFIQLVDEKVTKYNLLHALRGVKTIFTYNGSRFDLPFINDCLGVDLCLDFKHQDLMYNCWQNNLRGGFKAVEVQLGIPRRLKDVNGYEAVRLWRRYKTDNNLNALKMLLAYNKEDVINLKVLRERLSVPGLANLE